MKTQREMVCITCPMGCNLSVTIDDGKVIMVEGNTCPRGVVYANAECTNPVRTLTTIMKTKNGGVVSVKTDKPIPKDRMFECTAYIKENPAEDNVRIGDVIIEDILHTGANVIVTGNVQEG